MAAAAIPSIEGVEDVIVKQIFGLLENPTRLATLACTLYAANSAKDAEIAALHAHAVKTDEYIKHIESIYKAQIAQLEHQLKEKDKQIASGAQMLLGQQDVQLQQLKKDAQQQELLLLQQQQQQQLLLPQQRSMPQHRPRLVIEGPLPTLPDTQIPVGVPQGTQTPSGVWTCRTGRANCVNGYRMGHQGRQGGFIVLSCDCHMNTRFRLPTYDELMIARDKHTKSMRSSAPSSFPAAADVAAPAASPDIATKGAASGAAASATSRINPNATPFDPSNPK